MPEEEVAGAELVAVELLLLEGAGAEVDEPEPDAGADVFAAPLVTDAAAPLVTDAAAPLTEDASEDALEMLGAKYWFLIHNSDRPIEDLHGRRDGVHTGCNAGCNTSHRAGCVAGGGG